MNKKSVYISVVLITFVVSLFVLWPGGRLPVEQAHPQAVILDAPVRKIVENQGTDAELQQVVSSPSSSAIKITALKEFDLWLKSKPSDDLAQWQKEGLLLAKSRRDIMAELIKNDPKMALSQSVSFQGYADLPEAVKSYVEQPFSERIDLVVLPDEDGIGVDAGVLSGVQVSNNAGINSYIEFVSSEGQGVFNVYRYGARKNVLSKNNISAQGITLNGDAVIANTALMLVPTEERAYVSQHFSSNSSSPKTDFYTGDPIRGEAVLALAGGQVFHFSSTENVKKLNAKLTTLEAQNNPKVGSQVLFQVMGAEFDPTSDAGFSGFLDDYLSGAQVAADWTITPKDVFFIRVQTSDNVNPVVSQADLQAVLDSSSDLIRVMSQNKTYLNPAVSSQLITLSNTAAYYAAESSSVIYNEAKQLFDALGTDIDLTTYDIVGIHIGGTRLPVSWAGLASVGGPKHWLNDVIRLRTVTHEFGHNYGLSHSGFWDTTDGSVVGPGANVGYGDVFDMMGSGSAPEGHFNQQSQVYLDWVEAASWVDVTSSGTYRTYRFDHENAAGNRALRISRNGDGHYWLGHRQNFDSNAWLESGLYLLWQFEGVANRSSLIDTTPGSFADGEEDKNDAGIVLGQTYSDTTENIHITALAKGGAAPNEWIDVQVNLGAFPSNSAPTVSLVVPDTLVAREALTFTANASDPDGDILAYQWDFGDGVVHNSSASVTQTWLAGGSYTVKITVSDMKGQTATSQVNVVVSDPLTAWTDRISNTTEELYDIASNGSALLVVGRRPVLTSADGQTWTQLRDKIGTNIRLYGVIHDGSKWVAVGADYDFGIKSWVGAIHTSTDGSTWTEQHKGGGVLERIAFGVGTLVAVGDGGTILSSADGINWTPKTSGVTTTLRDVAFSNGTFVVVGGVSSSDQAVLSSTDANTWTNYASGAGIESWQNIKHISNLNNQFVASGWYSRIRYSTDSGQTFQTTRTNTEITPALAFGNQVYLASGIDKDNSDTDVDLVSVDGQNWTKLITPTLDDRNAAIFFNNTFITVGQNGSIRQSGVVLAPGSGGTDTDSDGAIAENSVPDLSGGGSGDGDGDGTADSTQSDVTSFLAIGAANWLTYRNNSGGAQSNPLTSAAPANVPTDQYLVYGAMQYDVDTAVGASITIEVYVTQNTAIQDYLLLSNDGQWKPQNATVTHTGNKTKLVFTVTEGGEFDRDASANGTLQLAQGGVMVRTGFEITSYAHSFGITELNTPTANQTFSITNKGSRSLTFNAAALSGAYNDQFNIGADNCSGQTIAAGASCTVDVNMQPTSVGSKSAWLEITTDDPDNATTAAFLNNYESTEQQARRRLPPVLYSLTGLDEIMTIGDSYEVTWELLGYHDDYFSTIVFFDCTGVAALTCGSNYSDNFESSGVLGADSVAVGNWTYNGVESKRTSFSYTFTPTSAQFPNPADIVVRFYRKNTDDSAAGKGSLSLIIPGNLSDVYYDTSGRRIQKQVQ